MKHEIPLLLHVIKQESMPHTLLAIHYNFGTLTKLSLPVKPKGIDAKCRFC